MSELAPPDRRRADARRNIAAVLDAAVAVLADRPDAGMGEIARAAGVARQTVYAHFGSREALLAAVADRALAQSVAAIDDTAPGDGPPREALVRLVDAWWDNVARHARVLEALSAVAPTAEAAHAFHGPIAARVADLARRGRRAGVFDRDLSADWLAAAFLGLMHTAAAEVAAGRMTGAQAGRALRRSVPRLFGAEG